jgi:hypothetical protein
LAGATGCVSAFRSTDRQDVKQSPGTERRLQPSALDRATDCHHHIFNHHYPIAFGAEQFADES